MAFAKTADHEHWRGNQEFLLYKKCKGDEKGRGLSVSGEKQKQKVCRKHSKLHSTSRYLPKYMLSMFK